MIEEAIARLNPVSASSKLVGIKPHALDAARFTAALVYIDDDTLQHDIVLRDLEFARQLADETGDDVFFFHADDRIEGAAQTEVGNVRGAVGKDSLVGRLDVSMRAVYDAGTAVQIPS